MKRPLPPASRIEPNGAARLTARPRRRVLLPTLVIALLAASRLAAQDSGFLPPSPWPAELGEAFKLYYADEFLEVQRVCRQLSTGTRDTRLRREATALAAMATMRLPGRDDRVNGRAQLAQLAEGDASLLTRPECQLAYGIAQTALSETASALYHLNQAAETFAVRGQSDRLAETCVALAEAWARHGEWEFVVPGLEIPRPESRAEADRIRTERIGALRERVAALPAGPPAAARIDLILAQHLLETEDGAAKGLALLEELTRGPNTAKATAQACLALAEHYEATQHWTEAARLYARVEAAGLGTLSRQAEQRRDAVLRPQLVLEVPHQVAVGQCVTVSLSVRNLAAVELEVRRVDLAGWLEQRQGRFAEAALPTTGALIAARDLDTALTTDHAWWRSESLDDPLTFDAPPGAVVVVAQAVDADGRAVTAKRLVLAGDLHATVFIGRQRAAIWAIRRQELDAAPSEIEPQARFWMHGSFVPTRPQFAAGVAVFDLPPEARLLRDKRWVCLVQAGEQAALCHGTLPAGIVDPQHQPAVALIGGPPELQVGQQWHVFGALLGGADDRAPGQPPHAVELELLDTFDRVHFTDAATVSDAGTFSAHLPISAAMAGEHLRVAVRLDGQILENVLSPLRAQVAPADLAPYRLDCDLPPWVPPTRQTVPGLIKAVYPWGTPLSDTTGHARFRAMRLPTVQPKRDAVQSDPVSRDFRLDRSGMCGFELSLSEFNLPEGPLAVAAWLDAAGWDGRHAQGFAEVLVGPEPVHLWLRCETDTPRVGEPLHVSVGWFDPANRAAGARPALSVCREGAPAAHLELASGIGGWLSRTWRPPAPGAYELVATLRLDEGQCVTVRDTIRVTGHRGTDERDPGLLGYEARFTRHEGRLQVRVRLEGQRRHPLLVLLEAGDPLAARQLPSLDGAAELLLPVAGRLPAMARVVLAAPSGQGVRILGATEIAPADDQSLTLTLSADPGAPAPGATVEISANCLRAGRPVQGATLTARLVDASRAGELRSLSGESHPKPPLLPAGIQMASSGQVDATAGAPGEVPNVIPETRELSTQLAQALFEGSTLWLDTQPSKDEATTFAVPLPPKPGLYRLVTVAQTPDGAFASETCDLDTRRGILLGTHVPEHLTLGDRSVATLIVRNDEPVATPARVTFDAGPGLQVEELRLVGRQGDLEPAGDDGAFALTLPPSATVTLGASIEAAQAGDGTVVLAVETARARRCATSSYTVHAYPLTDVEPREPSRGTVVVRRTLFLLEDEAVIEGDAAEREGGEPRERAERARVEIEPGVRMRPGQLLLVREEFALEQPLTQVEWEQRVPANCHTHAGKGGDLRRIGVQRELRLQSLTQSAAWLAAAQKQTHEYVIVPVRAGACQFPPPTVHADGLPVRVQVDQAIPRVLVAASD